MKFIFYILLTVSLLSSCKGPESNSSESTSSSSVPDATPPAQNSAAAYFPFADASKEKLFPIDSSKIVTMANGLQYMIVQEGQGNKPTRGQKVIAQYHGTLTKDGTKFDSSYDRGQPFEFTIGVGQVIKGWDEGFLNFTPGTKAILLIKPELGYGQNGSGNSIPPNSHLTFHVELLGINDAGSPQGGGMPGGLGGM